MTPLPTLAAPGAIERRRQLADTILMSGLQSGPVGHWTQGASRMAHALVGALGTRRADREEKEGKAAGAAGTQALLQALLNKGVQPSSMPMAGSPAGGAMAAAGNMEPTPAPGADRQALLDALTKAQGNEWVDPGMKQFAMQQLMPPEPMEPTSDIQNFEYGQKNPAFLEQQERLRRAGGTTVNVGPTGIDYGDPEAGLAWARDENGTVKLDDRGAPIAVPYQGGKPYLEQEAARTKADITGTQEERTSDIVTQDVDRAMSIIKSNPTFTTGLFGQMLQSWGGFKANDARGLIDTVKANVGFDRLQQMRAASPTGGALGPVSDFENRMLQSVVGSLDQSQTAEQILFNLQRVKVIYEKIINEGIPEGSPMPTGEAPQQPDAMQGAAPPASNDIFDDEATIPEGATVEDEQGRQFRKQNGQLVPVQ